MFENKIINGIHATRYIASWLRSGGKLYRGRDLEDFSRWLKSIGVSEEDRDHIWRMAQNGKMELEYSAKQFVANI